MHQTGPMILLSVTHMLYVLTKSVTVSVAVSKMGVVLRQACVKVNGQY